MIPATAIILAGGRGTRLQSVLSDLPKPLAPVAGRPFLAWQLDHLAQEGIKRVILSIGYKAEAFESRIGTTWKGMDIIYVREDNPLGTGGAIRWAWSQMDMDTCWVLNGDTYTDFSLDSLWDYHQSVGASCTVALKQMKNFDRYGTVRIGGDGQIFGFLEKIPVKSGLINAGVYLIEKGMISEYSPGEPFSFERDLLEKTIDSKRIYGLPVSGHFLDIGIPDDYDLAQEAIPTWANSKKTMIMPSPDQSWTLFLDRDGVLNERIHGDYVRHPDQFKWLPGVKEALKNLRRTFGCVVVVTNQQGIGKKWMTEEDLEYVHQQMGEDLEESGVVLDRIYHCPGLAVNNPVCRKPLPGMGLQALVDFPMIDLAKSVLIGDSSSDIEFGRRLGMYTIRIGEDPGGADYRVDSLESASSWLLQNQVKDDR